MNACGDAEHRLESGLEPITRNDTRVLVLGSFPGRASLAARAYYAHPRNAFWPIMAALIERADLAHRPFAQRYNALLDAGIGLWDVYVAARRKGSLDAAIRDATPADLATLCRRLPKLRAIALNGQTAAKAARTAFMHDDDLLRQVTLVDLPSTSPAHAALRLDDKRERWCRALSPFLRHDAPVDRAPICPDGCAGTIRPRARSGSLAARTSNPGDANTSAPHRRRYTGR